MTFIPKRDMTLTFFVNLGLHANLDYAGIIPIRRIVTAIRFSVPQSENVPRRKMSE